MGNQNKIAGSGQHSHHVPAVENLVVEIRDGNHNGTAIWLREDGTYAFASYDRNTLATAERCVLIVGQSVEGVSEPYGCDLDSPRGLMLVGLDADDDLSWIGAGADVLWDSKA